MVSESNGYGWSYSIPSGDLGVTTVLSLCHCNVTVTLLRVAVRLLCCCYGVSIVSFCVAMELLRLKYSVTAGSLQWSYSILLAERKQDQHLQK
jgi:hypothetical protein